ncbi:hypothetical protein GF385_00700 [Candidatus Dependentiae bacterium]|nr:hypothetical protein [Candidatus Dependentiae bacterium]
MMKSGTTVLIVESVEKAIKYYTEKLAFDIVELTTDTGDGGKEIINYAQLKKGKCFVMFRTPQIEELAEFSFIKRCASRCTGLFAEMKKGIEKYYQKCNKKDVLIISPLKDESYGYKTFSVRDPFGLRLTFAQKLENYQEPNTFFNSEITKNDISGNKEQDAPILERMIKYLKGFGILRRAAKKYSKLWIKKRTKK